MMKKIRLNCIATLDETFADFLLSRRAKGLAEKTLESYPPNGKPWRGTWTRERTLPRSKRQIWTL